MRMVIFRKRGGLILLVRLLLSSDCDCVLANFLAEAIAAAWKVHAADTSDLWGLRYVSRRCLLSCVLSIGLAGRGLFPHQCCTAGKALIQMARVVDQAFCHPTGR